MICVMVGIIAIMSVLLVKPATSPILEYNDGSSVPPSSHGQTETNASESITHADTDETESPVIQSSGTLTETPTTSNTTEDETEDNQYILATNAYSKWAQGIATAEDMQIIVDYLIATVKATPKIQNSVMLITVPDCNSFYYIGGGGYYFEDLDSLCSVIISTIIFNQVNNNCGDYCITYCDGESVDVVEDNYFIQLSMEYIS